MTATQARRIAVAAQGFSEPRPGGPITRAHLRRLISRIQVLQLDSVSVAVRAHYAPVFSRLGPYDRDVLDRAAWGPARTRLLAEYWAHEAALMAVDDWPLLRWRMRQYRHGYLNLGYTMARACRRTSAASLVVTGREASAQSSSPIRLTSWLGCIV